MANKMLIDATHPEETRVVVLRGNRVEEFDFESAQRKQLRGNIYLAKVTRVEPSLQAAFVDYGGNRHGFLAFSEIHPDYYQIPVADRQALIDEEERAQRAADDEVDRRSRRHRASRPAASAGRRNEVVRSDPAETPGGEPSSDGAICAQPPAEHDDAIGEYAGGPSRKPTPLRKPHSISNAIAENTTDAEHDAAQPADDLASDAGDRRTRRCRSRSVGEWTPIPPKATPMHAGDDAEHDGDVAEQAAAEND